MAQPRGESEQRAQHAVPVPGKVREQNALGATYSGLEAKYVLSLELLLYAVVTKKPPLVPYGLIWIGHVGVDRLLGFGLKYPTNFRATYLQRT
jgi:hypothetical protein